MFSVSIHKKNIQILSISKKFSTGYENLYQWGQSGTSISTFTLDILKVQEMTKTERIFFHLERPYRKLCSYLIHDMLYIIGSDREVQSQILEAIIEETIKIFTEFYKQKLDSYVGGFVSEFREFDEKFQDILESLKQYIKVVMAPCDACGSTTKIMVKKSLFDKPHKSYPIPLVYCHKGHALLIYLDKQFNVRASEIVDENRE